MTGLWFSIGVTVLVFVGFAIREHRERRRLDGELSLRLDRERLEREREQGMTKAKFEQHVESSAAQVSRGKRRDVAECKAYHADAAVRIAGELDGLGTEFAEDGIVRMVLRERVEQEKECAEHGCRCAYCCPRSRGLGG